MRDLREDLKNLFTTKFKTDLPDEYLAENGELTREYYHNMGIAQDLSYGITFVESNIALEWLERAVNAENRLEELKWEFDELMYHFKAITSKCN